MTKMYNLWWTGIYYKYIYFSYLVLSLCILKSTPILSFHKLFLGELKKVLYHLFHTSYNIWEQVWLVWFHWWGNENRNARLSIVTKQITGRAGLRTQAIYYLTWCAFLWNVSSMKTITITSGVTWWICKNSKPELRYVQVSRWKY